MAKLYWVFVCLLVAVISHVSYVLFAPHWIFQRQLSSLTDGKPYNQFLVLDHGRQTQLLPAATSKSVVGICKFDLTQGNINLSTKLPHSYWTLAIYTQSGHQVYALNDTQSGTSEFKIELSQSPSFLQQLFSKGRGDDAAQIENLGWHAETSEPRGIVVMWIPLVDELMRPQIEATVKGSLCAPKT